MATAFEITGSFGNIVADNDILFPNVLTCVAVICRISGGLVGVHMTLADRGRISQVAQHVIGRYGRPSDVYVVGPVLGAYNASGFANFGCPVRIHDTPGGIDVRARTSGGSLAISKSPAGAGGSDTTIGIESFV